MEVAVTQVSIDKLRSDNFDSWKEDIKVLLLDRNCWEIVSGEEKRPNETEVKDLKDHKIRYGRAYSTIYLNKCNDYKALLAGTNDPKEVWEKLKNHFKPESRVDEK